MSEAGAMTSIRLLIIHDQADEVEQKINGIRNLGIAVRAHIAESLEDFNHLCEQKTWDCIILKDELSDISAKEILTKVRSLAKDLPVIVSIEDYNIHRIKELVTAGAADVILAQANGHLSFAVKREVESLADRRACRRLKMSLIESEKRCNKLIHTSRDAVAYVVSGMHVFANSRYLDIFGLHTMAELDGMPILDFISRSHQAEMKEFLKQYARGEGAEASLDTQIVDDDGVEKPVSMHFSQASYDGENCTQLMIRFDEEDLGIQTQLSKISHQDLLTGLYNRQYLLEVLDKAIDEAQSGKRNSALIYLKINRYSVMQGEIGIANADLVVSDAASQMQRLIPEGGILAHFADDVFALVYPSGDQEHIRKFVLQINNSFDEYLPEVNGRSIPVSFRMGIVLLNDSVQHTQAVLMQAHASAENAEERLENDSDINIIFYEQPAPQADAAEDKDIEFQLQEAIESGQFKILFQPIISLRAQNQPFYEVLLRMISEDGTEISPNAFIDAAASQKVAEKIDRWVVVQSIKALALKYQSGEPTRLIINLTPQTLIDQSFIPWLSMALKASRLPHDALVFQLPENEAYRYLKEAKVACQALSELHCKISISRFGAMSNPFNIFRHIQTDFVKIDGSFTRESGEEEGSKALAELVETAHSMGKLTIASFVEEVKVLTSLYSLGVNYIQGYYLQSPAETMDYDFDDDD